MKRRVRIGLALTLALLCGCGAHGKAIVTGETPGELRERIGELAYEVTQNAATERGFTGEYDDFYQKGLYVDVVSGEALFLSTDKYDAGCGWPSFTQPIDKNAVEMFLDLSHWMARVEVRSSGSGSHLGHVFDDGPGDVAANAVAGASDATPVAGSFLWRRSQTPEWTDPPSDSGLTVIFK